MNKPLSIGAALALAAALPSPARAQPEPPPPADDLSQAADATAEAAALAPTAPTAAPAPAADDIDLAALGLDPSSATAFDDKLNLYGFADFGYSALVSGTPLIADYREFSYGNLNLYLAKNLTPRWRALAEVRFLLAPNGARNPDGTYQSTAVPDPSNFDRPVSWGGIQIERAYIEYDVHARLSVRAGRYLTPYGIWNIDHGSPAIIGVSRPYIIGEQFFPERQTGLELFGAAPLGDYKLRYHATVSNGRNPIEASRDPDKKLAFGGRLELEAPLAGGTLRIGGSAYVGRETELAATATETPRAFDEIAFGFDAQYLRGGLHLQAEYIGQHRELVAGPPPGSPGGATLVDGMVTGFYGLAGYRFDRLWHVMPYALYEDYHPFDRTAYRELASASFGLNFRPTPTVVLKAAASHVWFEGGLFDDATLQVYGTQIAWVF